MINFRTLFCTFFLFYSVIFYAQYNGLDFAYPLDRVPVVTGNYGELRPNHFHAGIDFSTDPVANLPIKNIADGYVSRIKISSGGYGKVLYVTHANGYVSVYAHQKIYGQKINDYVRKNQIEQKKNEIELYPSPNELVVKKGEVIGFTGNTGSSTGPHLHFEVREEKSEIPINPLLIYYVKDNVKPELTHLALYNTADTNLIKRTMMLPVKKVAENLTLDKKTILLNNNTFALAFSGFDRANGSTNKNNIYEAKLSLDGLLIYHHQLNYISFDNARYINVFSEKEAGVKLQKCFTPLCFDARMYKKLVNGGKIILPDTLEHKVMLEVADERGNKNTLEFIVKAKAVKGYMPQTIKPNAFCNEEFSAKKENAEVYIKPGTLSKNCFISIYVNKLGKTVIGIKEEPLLKAFYVKIKVASVLNGLENKLVMMQDDNCLTGIYENGWLKSESKSFGAFTYTYDTIAPKITLPIYKTLPKRISFKVTDNLSGIGEYHVYFNNIWQIAEYDAKSNTIFCDLSNNSANGKLKIEVSDKVGNKAVLNREL